MNGIRLLVSPCLIAQVMHQHITLSIDMSRRITWRWVLNIMDPTTSARFWGSEPSSIPKLDIHNYPNYCLL
jgi:hypothetical protein